ncbi:MFS general substrate transporter [Laetiporus sulphureus 93-53]|uniref:MFS general substrate transporter n=1 Tax=Laetiporus sulphureus 93-53 TaxID=1314785 RepID=A0A165EEW8_9APHY|nr:MFS general substrate transporter [Laetiporus sulphureus 93-53]KZT06904.1 MFS general substrate transporter [Laetiporus sulphureus 93-53]
MVHCLPPQLLFEAPAAPDLTMEKNMAADEACSRNESPALPADAFNEEAYHINGHRRIVVLTALGLVLFISALDSTIVSVALPVIGSDFNDYSRSSWIVTAYLITYTAFLPIVSKFTDILGRRPVLVLSTIFFMIWSGACGGAKTMNQLIVFRAMQGIGGSAIYSAVIVTLSTFVSKQEVAKYTPMIGVVYALSSVAGPLIGGAIVSHTHWGWIFFVNLPIGFVGTILLLYGLSDPYRDQDWRLVSRRLDWIGSFLLLASSVLLCFGLQVGGTKGYPWVSAKVLAPLIISGCIVPVFIYFETRHPEPLVPLRLFRSRNFAFIILFTLCLGAGFYTVTIYLPQRMEIVNRLSAITSGVRMLPQLTLVGVVSFISGAIVMITRRYLLLMWFSSCVGAIGCGLLTILTAQTRFPQQYGFEALIGYSVGITIPVSTMIVQFSTDRPDLASATGFQSFARQLGGVVAISISTAVLNSRVEAKLNMLEGTDSPLASAALREAILEDPTGVMSELSSSAREYVQAAYSDGFSKVFLAGAVWLAVSALATFALEHKLPPELERKKPVVGAAAESQGPEGETVVDVDVPSQEKSADVERHQQATQPMVVESRMDPVQGRSASVDQEAADGRV